MIPKKQKIHTRKIDIATYEGSADSVIVEGILKDERLLESYRFATECVPPGTVHHMIVRMEVKGPQLIIEDIEVEMPTVPQKVCKDRKALLADPQTPGAKGARPCPWPSTGTPSNFGKA